MSLIPSNTHSPSCLIWTSSDPADGCSCGAQVEPLLTLAERLDALVDPAEREAS